MKTTTLETGFANVDLTEEMYAKYIQNPQSVSPSWRKFFEDFDATPKIAEKATPLPSSIPADADREMSILNLIQAYRIYGHLLAKTNPVVTHPQEEPKPLKLSPFGFTRADLSKEFPTFGLLPAPAAPLAEIINTLKMIYCDKIGFEYMGIGNPEMEAWIQQKIEPSRCRVELSMDQKRMILQQLNKSELFEVFLHTKYVGQKRFSLEGAETLIPMLEAILETGSSLGMDEFFIGMAHRGRLNVLSNILNKSNTDIFSEFDEGYIPDSFEGSGDVKYHKGFFSEVLTLGNKKVKVSLTPNPSHLESVDPVVEGQVKARQIIRDDQMQEHVVPILVHGDAAVAGQGVVYETLQMYGLKGYSTGGTLHIVVNNQIGFTTLPSDSRSTLYCTDIAHAFGAPVFHVNAEDPESCVFVTNLAIEIRDKFKSDVFIDLVCYRKYGHNETDEPAFTQPLEYKMIRQKRPIREIYRDQLIHNNVLEKHMAESLEVEFKKALQEAQKGIKITPIEPKKPQESGCHEKMIKPIETGVPKATLEQIAERISIVPDNFTIHPKVGHLVKDRLAMIKENKPIDWGMAELMAYGTLLWDNVAVRLAGQDSCRGTFSHRHGLWMDQVAERQYFPLQHLKPGQGRFDLINSPLSEFAVLGFEYGYSIANPDALTIWEAQFGDFANGAQIIIDQYISTAEQKWGQKSGLTLLLPHGYEGQGPEHSSGRMERYLSLCGNDNMILANPTTPAQLFHLLRRQIVGEMRKPLIVFTPKGLLRHPECISFVPDLEKGCFKTLINDPHPPQKAARLIFCSGRIYYDLSALRAKQKMEDLALVRIEQLYPLDEAGLKAIIDSYKDVKTCYWVQEEPSNMGAWDYMRPILRELLPQAWEFKYVGRSRSASPAVGSHALHKKELAAILEAIVDASQGSAVEIARNYKS